MSHVGKSPLGVASVTAHRAVRERESDWSPNRLPRTRTVTDRVAWLAAEVAGKRVAHIGFADIGCEVTNVELGRWLHDRLTDSAKHIVGLDIDEVSVDEATTRGLEAHAVDCTDPDAVRLLGLDPFDVVLLGEVIEHVDNAGGLLEASSALLGSGGQLIVTTPNARRPADLLFAAFRREIVHPDHVAIYSPSTLSALLRRHGLAVHEVAMYVNPIRPAKDLTIKGCALRLASATWAALAKRLPYIADGLIVVARRESTTSSTGSGER